VKIRITATQSAQYWQDIGFVALGDCSQLNRPKGGSAGGLLAIPCGPDLRAGEVGRVSLMAWRSFRLPRVATGTNDGEVQDTLFKLRMLWAELNGANSDDENFYLRVLDGVKAVPGIIGTDSKGGYDAIELNESANLGLSNARSAFQGFQMKENLRRDKATLIWLAGDWNLADAPKKSADSRQGLKVFRRASTRRIKYDTEFVVSARKAKRAGNAANEIYEQFDDHG
jgi:hypothetical protein